MRTTRWIGRVLLAALAAVSLGWTRPSSSVQVVGGTPDQREMARWATARFDAAGLVLPELEIRFHRDRDACRGRLGYYFEGGVDVCRLHADLWASRELLHEMAHGWLAANLTDDERDRFLDLRGLPTWNDPSVVWDERGFEQGAEILAWAIGDQAEGLHIPSIPDNARPQLAAAYRLLTSEPLPKLTPSVTWHEPE
jgi:hypothetical protein